MVEEVVESLDRNIIINGQQTTKEDSMVSKIMAQGECPYDNDCGEYYIGNDILKIVDQLKKAPLLIKIFFVPPGLVFLLLCSIAPFPEIYVPVCFSVVLSILVVIFDATLSFSFPFVTTLGRGWSDLSFGETTIVVIIGALIALYLLIAFAYKATSTRIEFQKRD